MEVIKPETYRCGCGCGASYTANDANSDIDPTVIAAAVDEFEATLADEIQTATTAFSSIREDVEDCMVVKGKRYGTYVDQIIEKIQSIGAQISEVVQSVNYKENAILQHNLIQEYYNSVAQQNATELSNQHAQQISDTNAQLETNS